MGHLKMAGGRETSAFAFAKPDLALSLSELLCTQVHLHCDRAGTPSPEVREQQVTSSDWATCAWPLASMRGWPAVRAKGHPSSLPSATQVCPSFSSGCKPPESRRLSPTCP